MSLKRALELREEAGRANEAARKLQQTAEAEKRTMTAEEATQFTAYLDESEIKVDEANRIERLLRNSSEGEAEKHNQLRGNPETSDDPKSRASAAYNNAFVTAIARGAERLDAEQRATLQIHSDIGGGVFRPGDTFINALLKAVDDAVVIRRLATIQGNIPFGTSLGVPTLDGDISAFEWGAGELTAAAEDTSLAFGKREWKPQPLKRKIIKVSKKLLENATANIEQLVVDRVRVALAETLEQAYMTGDGAQQPLGLFTASADGIPTSRDVNSGAAAALADDGLIAAQGSLKTQYQGSAQWLAHRDIITKVRQLKDGEGRYAWQPGLQLGMANTILGRPYISSEFAPNTYTAGQYVMIYGDFSYYWIADSLVEMTVQRLVELYSLTGQVGLLFEGMATDGMPALSEAFVRVKLAA